MAKFEFDLYAFENIIDKSILVGHNLLEQKVLENVPRNQDDLPKPIILKTKETPERNIREGNKHYYRKPVTINGQWYEGVTGNLKRSIGTQKLGSGEYIVGVRSGPTEEYAKAQEFGTDDIPERSFLRKPLEKNHKQIMGQIQKTFKELSDKA